jgi:hypothetical protein
MNSSGSAMGLVAGAFEGRYVLSGCIKRAEFLDNTKDCHFSTRNPSHESCCDFTFLFILFLRQ